MEQFCFKQESGTLFLRGVGRLTSQNSEEFKKTVSEYIDNTQLKEVLLDLSNCQYMDSTFLGLLVGFYKKMRKIGDFCIIKPSPEALQHLSSMGIDKIISIQQQSIQFPVDMWVCNNNPTRDPESILNAHKNLMELSRKNSKKFALLASALESHIHQRSTNND